MSLLREEITNVIYAIEWAKDNTVNSLILSSTEIDFIKTIKEESLTFINIEELIEFAEINVASDGKSLLYIVSLPRVINETCKKNSSNTN